MYNPALYVDGKFLAKPDAWWPEAGVAAEVDSRAWHLLPADYERTLARHDRMIALGVRVLHFPPAGCAPLRARLSSRSGQRLRYQRDRYRTS